MIRSSLESKPYGALGQFASGTRYNPLPPVANLDFHRFGNTVVAGSNSLPNPRPIFPLEFVLGDPRHPRLALADCLYLLDIIDERRTRRTLAGDAAALRAAAWTVEANCGYSHWALGGSSAGTCRRDSPAVSHRNPGRCSVLLPASGLAPGKGDGSAGCAGYMRLCIREITGSPRSP